jgi:hypothetical protein
MTLTGSDPERRRALLERHARAQAALEELDVLERKVDRAAQSRLAQHEAPHVVRTREAIEAYLAGLPRREIARCPFTNEVLLRTIDDAGLDGLWWRAGSPVRPVEPAPRTFVTLAGAVAIARPVERTPFLVTPGPAVPFVIPRLLDGTQAVAVISSFAVGRHTAYAVTYFGDPPEGIDPANDWGTDHWQRAEGWGSREDDPGTFDPDIAKWIGANKVRWIAPGDRGLTLRSEIDGCPYAGLRGTRSPQYVQHGEVWT